MNKFLFILILFFSNFNLLQSQPLTQPRPSPLCSVTHRLGITDIKITYSSPQVRDRKIWGGLVPYNEVWRAGADNNTIFETAHDVAINDQLLPAGKYGLHIIPEKEEWIIIFSKNYTSWGSFTYDETEDFMRIKVKPIEASFQEYLSFEFGDRSNNQVDVALIWEKIKIPFTIKAEVNKIVINNFKAELRSRSQFDWQAWHQAAQYSLYNGIELEQGLEWVNYSIDGFFAAQENYDNLKTKAEILEKLDSLSASKLIMEKAINHPTVTALDLYRYGRQLLNKKLADHALTIFQKSKKQFPNHWLSEHGLARGYSALGKYEKALLHEKNAFEIAPDESKGFLEKNIEKLKNNEDFN